MNVERFLSDLVGRELTIQNNTSAEDFQRLLDEGYLERTQTPFDVVDKDEHGTKVYVLDKFVEFISYCRLSVEDHYSTSLVCEPFEYVEFMITEGSGSHMYICQTNYRPGQ